MRSREWGGLARLETLLGDRVGPSARQSPMTFAQQLKPLVDKIGSARASQLCGVNQRTIQRWLKRPPPNLANQAGALLLLRAV